MNNEAGNDGADWRCGRWLHVSHETQMVREEIGIRELGAEREESKERRSRK